MTGRGDRSIKCLFPLEAFWHFIFLDFRNGKLSDLSFEFEFLFYRRMVTKRRASAPNSNASRKKSAQGQGGKAPPRQVYRPTDNTIQSSFDNTYNLPNKTADNQTEQNLFYVNKETSQHIQISADPSTSTASHDSQLRVDSSHQVIVDAIDSSLAANNSNVDNSGIQAIMPIISQPDHELINTMESNISLV